MARLFRYIWHSQFGFDVDLNKLQLNDFDSLQVQFKQVYAQLKLAFHDDPQVLYQLDDILNKSQLVFDVAPVHDYDPHNRGNGYWTYLKLLTKFGLFIQLHCQQKQQNTDEFKDKVINVCKLVVASLNLCEKIINKESMDGGEPDHSLVLGSDLFDADNLMASKLNLIELLGLLKSLKSSQASLYSLGNSFWVSPTMVGVLQIVTTFMAVFSTQWKSFKLYNFFSRANRSRMFASMGQNINIDCLKYMWSMAESPFLQIFIQLQSDVSTGDVYVPRQARWIIDRDEPKVMNNKTCLESFDESRKKIRCLLIKSCKFKASGRSILLYIHGGGFISQRPETHECYLRDWAAQLENSLILCVDYSLSPEGPFPAALQEILDCYLWLKSGHSSVEKAIGFHPNKIALAGDSAGGNLSMSLLLVLRTIQAQLVNDPRETHITFPEAIFCYYAPFILTTILSPSRMIGGVDGLIPVGVMLCCVSAYTPVDVLTKGMEDDPSINGSSFFNRSDPWYKDLKRAPLILRNINRFTLNPFVSPNLWKDFENIDVALYLFPATYDSFLDDSIEMAKQWKSKVHLEIADDLPHGFLNFVKFSSKAKEASDRCLLHIKDVLE